VRMRAFVCEFMCIYEKRWKGVSCCLECVYEKGWKLVCCSLNVVMYDCVYSCVRVRNCVRNVCIMPAIFKVSEQYI